MTAVTLDGSRSAAQSGNDLGRLGPSFGLLVGIDLLSVGKNVERSRTAHADTNWNLQFTLNVLLQAHGLYLQVASEEAALDYDIHRTPLL
jgi:hypothetical protein